MQPHNAELAALRFDCMQALEIGPADTSVATKPAHNAAKAARINGLVILLPFASGGIDPATGSLLLGTMPRLETKFKPVRGLPCDLHQTLNLGSSAVVRHHIRLPPDRESHPPARPQGRAGTSHRDPCGPHQSGPYSVLRSINPKSNRRPRPAGKHETRKRSSMMLSTSGTQRLSKRVTS